MSDEIERLKLVIDMAKDNGRKEAVCDLQKEELQKANDEITDLKARLEATQVQLAESQNQVLELKQLLEKYKNTAQQSPTILINNFFLLDKPKTEEYVSQLDDKHRIFTGHFLEHTLADSSSMTDHDSVRKITQLGDIRRQNELADSINKAATKPTNVIDKVGQMTEMGPVGTYNNEVREQNNAFSMPPIDQMGNKQLEDKGDESERN